MFGLQASPTKPLPQDLRTRTNVPMHGGSNGYNLAHIWLDPQHDVAMVVMTNIAGKQTNEALLDIAARLYAQLAGDTP